MKGIFLSFLVSFVRRLLTGVVVKAGQNLWVASWTIIFQAIEEAEKRWKDGGSGKQKKEWVVEVVMEYIRGHISLGWFQKKIVELFVSQVADAIVIIINEELGHGWLERVKSLERELAGKIPFIN